MGLHTSPPDGVIVTYSLQHKPAGEVTLSFPDAQEGLIQTFSSQAPEPGSSGQVEQRVPAEAGMHRFIWHMRYPDARVVPGDTLLEDKVGGPLAPP